MRKEITERRETINTPSHETKDVVQDDDESGTMDWFTSNSVFFLIKYGRIHASPSFTDELLATDREGR